MFTYKLDCFFVSPITDKGKAPANSRMQVNCARLTYSVKRRPLTSETLDDIRWGLNRSFLPGGTNHSVTQKMGIVPHIAEVRATCNNATTVFTKGEKFEAVGTNSLVNKKLLISEPILATYL